MTFYLVIHVHILKTRGSNSKPFESQLILWVSLWVPCLQDGSWIAYKSYEFDASILIIIRKLWIQDLHHCSVIFMLILTFMLFFAATLTYWGELGWWGATAWVGRRCYQGRGGMWPQEVPATSSFRAHSALSSPTSAANWKGLLLHFFPDSFISSAQIV